MTDTIRTSKILQEIIAGREDTERMTIYEVNKFLSVRGFGLVLLLFSFPMALPIPYPPGFTTVLGVPLIFFALQMIQQKKDPWLPKWVGRKSIKVAHLRFAVEKSEKFFKFAEKVMKPRLEFMTSAKGEIAIGVFVLLCAISIALPIILGNAVPSIGIFVMSIGLLNKDGLIVIIGMLISVIGLAIAIAVVIFGAKFITSLFYKITALI